MASGSNGASDMKASDFTRSAPGQLIRIPEGVGAFLPDPLPPPKSAFDYSACCQIAEEAVFQLGGLRALVETAHSGPLLVDSFLRREAVRSSRIEGTHTRLGELLLFEVGEESSEADAADADQVNRNFKAFQYGIERVSKLPVSGKLFREVHGILFENANRLEKAPGQYRRTSTMIGQKYESIRESYEKARFIPAPAECVEEAMKELENFINIPEKSGHLPNLVQMALVHYQFETIHPFMDGNGRIGRLAVSLLLKDRGFLPDPILCLSAYMDERREAYVDALLAVSQKGDWLRWVNLFLGGVRDQAIEDQQRCKALLALYKQYLEICDARKVGLGVVDSLFKYPVTTNSHVAGLLEAEFKTGARCVEILESKGILTEVTGRTSNRVYLAQEIIDLLEGPLPSVSGS
jgi:Fic family protein